AQFGAQLEAAREPRNAAVVVALVQLRLAVRRQRGRQRVAVVDGRGDPGRLFEDLDRVWQVCFVDQQLTEQGEAARDARSIVQSAAEHQALLQPGRGAIVVAEQR